MQSQGPPTNEQHLAAIAAAAIPAEREDPLLNWTPPAREECPICLLPLPFDEDQLFYKGCCGKTICGGCFHDQVLVDVKDGKPRSFEDSSVYICPFCRSEDDDVDVLDRDMKQAKAGHHSTFFHVGRHYFFGQMGLPQDKGEGIKWWRRAAEVGVSIAIFSLGICYEEGDGVEQNLDRALEYCQKAAELGNIDAFVAVGRLCIQKGEMDEAVLNLRKAVICGLSDIDQFNGLRACYRGEYITKEEYAFTLRENQKATDEMKSESREKVKKLSLML